MAGLIEELIDILEKENEEYRVLLKLSKVKTGIIIRNDIQELSKIVEEEQIVVGRISPLDKKRVEYTNDIATVINRKPETLTITRLMELMEGQPKIRKRLAEVHDKLHDTMTQMAKVNEMNKGLLQESLDLVNFDINLLNNLKQAPLTADYNKSAYNTETRMESRGAFDTKQ